MARGNSVDLRRLRSFIQIADSGSISRAAAACGLAQPALSQQLAALEQDLKVRLLDRSSTGVKLTPAGAALYGRAQVILRQVDDLREDVRSPSNRLSGPVAIGLPPSLAEKLTLPLLDTLCRDYPDLRPQVLEEGSPMLEDLLVNGGLDVAILARRPDRAEVEAERLFSEPLLLVAPAAWDLPAEPSLEDMSRVPWVTTRRTHSVRVLVEAVFAQAGLEHRVVAEIDSLPTVVRCVQRGLGATVLPKSVAEHATASGGVRTYPFSDPPVERPMFLCWRRGGDAGRRVALVVDLIRDLARP